MPVGSALPLVIGGDVRWVGLGGGGQVQGNQVAAGVRRAGVGQVGRGGGGWAVNTICQIGKFRENGGNGGEMDKLLVFCGKMGTTLLEKHKKHTFGAYWGLGGWGVVLSDVLEEKWGGKGGEMGEMRGNVGGWLRKHLVYDCLRFVYLCVVQLSTVYIHITSSAQFYLQPFYAALPFFCPWLIKFAPFKGVCYVPIKVIQAVFGESCSCVVSIAKETGFRSLHCGDDVTFDASLSKDQFPIQCATMTDRSKSFPCGAKWE